MPFGLCSTPTNFQRLFTEFGEIEEPEDGPACSGTDDSATEVDFSPEEICEASNSYCIINCYFVEREVAMG